MKKLLALLLLVSFINIVHAEVITHDVQSGETLYGLSIKYGVSTSVILEENKLKSNDLKVNQILNITKNEVDQYIVIKGDSLSVIAEKNDISLKLLLLVNRIDKDYTLNIGELLVIPTTPEKKVNYTIKKGDTLSWISMTYNIDTETLIKINKIQNSNIKIGEKLSLIDKTTPVTKQEIKKAAVSVRLLDDTQILTSNNTEYKVEAGDTLSAIALNYQTSIDDILELNGIEGSNIRVDQILKLPSYAKKREPINYNIYHTVVKGDTLSGISYEYNISETLLKEINSISGDKITIGQALKLIPSDKRTHKVSSGETLWAIARKYNVSVDQLMQYNHLNSTMVPVGKVLTLYDYSVVKHTVKKENFSLVSLKYSHNTTKSQPYKNYSIDELINPLSKYNSAKDNWKKFSALIENEPEMSDDLKDWTVILDPGHGGKDPGAIATVNLNGSNCYMVEDEYAYDTTVRLYELLKRNGAEVHMTILSPDHITRNPNSNTTTFINEKNEIYNNYELNKINNSTIWPVGGQWGLNQRVLITNNLLSITKNKNTIFISIHADNDVDRGVGKLVLFNDRNSKIDDKSKEFAEAMINELGSDSSAKGMSLAVLNNNDADVKVLVELRNMAHLSEAMALLDNEKRQNDALMILNGIKNYINLKY